MERRIFSRPTPSGYITRRSELAVRPESGRSSRRTGTLATIAAVLSFAIVLVTPGCRPATNDTRSVPKQLLPETTEIHGHLLAGREDEYSLDLDEEECVHFEVSQEAVDVEGEIIGPDNEQELFFDLPVARDSPERVCFVAPDHGLYTVRVRPFGGAGGDYTMLVHRQAATPADHDCHEASRRFVTAESQRAQHIVSEALATEYEAIGRLFESAGETYLAGLALRQAGTQWYRLGQSVAAIERFREASSFARSAGSDSLEASVLNRMGNAFRGRGELAAAERVLLQALDGSRRGNHRKLWASTLNNLALVEEARGEPHRAIGRYNEALEQWRQMGSQVDLVKTLMNLADDYARLDDHRQALYLLGDAAEIAHQIKDQELEAGVLMSLGWAHYLRGRPQDAVPVLQRSVKLWRRLGSLKDEAAALDRLGSVWSATGDYQAALTAYQDSLALSEQGENPRDVANTTVNIGCLYERWGRGDAASRHLAHALKLFEGIDDPKAFANLEYCTARTEYQRGDLDAAIAWISAALRRIDGLRDVARLRGERYRPIWLWQEYSEYEIELLMEKFRTTCDKAFAVAAFEASDLARARNFLELVMESQTRDSSLADDDLQDQQHQIQEDLNAAQKERGRLLDDQAPAEAVTAVERRLDELTLSLERTRAAIRATQENLREMDVKPVALDELQQLLDPRTTLLSYVLGEKRSYLFAVGRGSFDVWELAPRPRLDLHAEAFYEALRRSRVRDYQHVLAGRTLASLLIPEGAIPPSSGRLLVLPAGYLHYVPFAVLPSPGKPSRDGEERLLGDDFEILYLPSASILAALRRRDSTRPRAPKTVAVYADAVFSQADPRVSGKPSAPVAEEPVAEEPLTRAISPERLPVGPLPRLLFTREEADSILALVPGSDRHEAIGFAASKQAMLETPLDLYRIVHFATHAQIDESFPELSGLVLSRFDEKGRPIDGDLYLHEIYGLRLASDLVVLSGCQTALGKRVRGDGLVSMTRGFLYAGSSQVLVSLWSVDDEATAALMAELYRGLLVRGESPAAALRSAQRWMRRQERWSTPYYWGAFVLEGDG